MGGEGKSKKRRPPPSSPSPPLSNDDDERSKKRSRREGKEKKSSRKEKKKSHRSSRSRDGKEKKSREKHRHSKKNLDSIEELSKDDYFSKNNEFSTWLKEEKGIYFSDLSSEAARDLFLSFVKDWNSQKLQPQYYEGIATAPRTAHNWKIRHGK